MVHYIPTHNTAHTMIIARKIETNLPNRSKDRRYPAFYLLADGKCKDSDVKRMAASYRSVAKRAFANGPGDMLYRNLVDNPAGMYTAKMTDKHRADIMRQAIVYTALYEHVFEEGEVPPVDGQRYDFSSAAAILSRQSKPWVTPPDMLIGCGDLEPLHDTEIDSLISGLEQSWYDRITA